MLLLRLGCEDCLLYTSAAAVVDDQQGAAEIGALFVGAAVVMGEIGAGGCRFTDNADILRVNICLLYTSRCV